MPTPVGNPKQIDPSSIPPAVRKAAELANKAMAEQAAARTAEEGQSPPFQEPPQPEPERQPEAAPPEAPPAPEPPQPEPERPPEPPPAEQRAAEPPDDESWKQKYDRQVGRTRRLQQDLQAMSTRVDEMQRLLSTMQSAPAPAAASPFSAEQLLTPEEQEEWKEVLPVVEKRFRELSAPVEHQFKQEIDQLKQQLDNQHKTTVASARDRLHSTLNTHPVLGLQNEYSWQALNNDDDFVEWVQYLDPLSGRKRQSLLKDAYDLNDAGRMVAIFEAYLRERGLTPAAHQTNGNGAASAPPASNGLERFAAPGPTRSAPASSRAPAGPQHFTTGDITRFYTDRTAGRWKGREAEANAYEAEIFKAQRAGRIRPGPPQP
jgi:hypothetical protein